MSRGFSLMECLVALFLGTLVLGALVTGLLQFQRIAQAVQLTAERDRDHHLAPVLLARWAMAAGNGLPPPRSLDVAGGQVGIRADLEGNRGFPDGDLDDPFEDIAIRFREGSLQLRSGRGRFEPFLRHVADLRVSTASDRIRVELVSRVADAQLVDARSPVESEFLIPRMVETTCLFPEVP